MRFSVLLIDLQRPRKHRLSLGVVLLPLEHRAQIVERRIKVRLDEKRLPVVGHGSIEVSAPLFSVAFLEFAKRLGVERTAGRFGADLVAAGAAGDAPASMVASLQRLQDDIGLGLRVNSHVEHHMLSGEPKTLGLDHDPIVPVRKGEESVLTIGVREDVTGRNVPGGKKMNQEALGLAARIRHAALDHSAILLRPKPSSCALRQADTPQQDQRESYTSPFANACLDHRQPSRTALSRAPVSECGLENKSGQN